MSEHLDQPLPGFAKSAGPPTITGTTAVLERSTPDAGLQVPDAILAPVVAMRMRPAPEPIASTIFESPSATSPKIRPKGASSGGITPQVAASSVRRPGAIGCVTVRAPLLGPTRSETAPVSSRRHDSTPTHRRADVKRSQPHPRLVDRQRAIRRADRVARLRPLLVPVVLVAAAVVAAVTVLTSPLFSVSRVVLRFSGTAAEQQEIARIITPMRDHNIVRLDVGNRESKLRSLPWVDTATVRRSFPRTVEVRVTAHDVAGAVTLPNGRVAMTATDGSVLSVVGADDPSVFGLARFDLGLTAIPAPNDAFADPAPAVLASAKAIERRLPGRLRRVVLRDDGVEWLLEPTAGGASVRVLIGRPRDSDIPAAALASVLSRSGPTPSVIDLRTPDTPVLTFSPAR